MKLVVCTQMAPIILDDPPPLRVETGDLRATRTTTFEWDLASQINTMHRHWRMDDGTEHHDTITWRVTGPRELEPFANHAGFQRLEVFTDPHSRGDPINGAAATAWFVASFGSRNGSL